LLKKLQFQKVVRLNDSQMMPHVMDEIVKDSTESVKPLDIHQQLNPLVDMRKEGELIDEHGARKGVAVRSKELVFLHSGDSIIEKQIGRKEEVGMQILIQNIVGFSDGIRFSPSSYKPDAFIRIHGQGIIYMETLT